MKKNLLIIGLLFFILSSCSKDDNKPDTKWWILVHSYGNYNNAGIYLYNETNSVVERKLNLPDEIDSPHALAFDGKSLWLGGMGNNESIYELNPIDGSVISKISNTRAEGIAFLNEDLYYACDGNINRIKKDGTPIKSFSIPTNTIQDIAFSNSTLYYVVNSDTDPIIKFNLETEENNTVINTNVVGLYTLAIWRNDFIVIDDLNEIRRFDIVSGEKISDNKIYIDGWITAIALYIE